MDPTKFQGLVYPSTNECLHSIICGLEPNETDRILAAGGSGDQAFAMLETGAKVVCVDNDAVQVEYIRERCRLLKEGDYRAFTYPAVVFDKDVMTYFKKHGRKQRIRRNLRNLEIRLGNIVPMAQTEKGFTKIYLSNILGFHRTSSEYQGEDEFIQALEAIARNLEKGKLIYLTNHGWLCEAYPAFANFIKGTALFEVDKYLTDKTENCENRTFNPRAWSPGVYRIK